MATLQLEVITAEREVLKEEVEIVVAPGREGELGILPHHTPLLAQLQPGEIRLKNGDETHYFAVSGGFVEVEKEKVYIFAETAEMAQEIDAERARQAAERAKAALKAAKQDIEFSQAEASLRRALARLRVLEGLRRVPRSGPRRP